MRDGKVFNQVNEGFLVWRMMDVFEKVLERVEGKLTKGEVKEEEEVRGKGFLDSSQSSPSLSISSGQATV